MRSFTKTILAAVLFSLSSGLASAAPTLNVHIQKANLDPVPYVTVAAIEFGMNGPSTYTLIGQTNGSGDVSFTLSSGTYGRSYNLYYSSHGFSPSISDQFNNPEYDPNRHVWAQGDNVYYSTFTIAKDLTEVGRLKLEFTNATAGKVLFGGVYNMKSQMQGGSGIVIADGSGDGVLAVDNVPYTTESNTYNIGLYDPEKNLGIGRNVMALLDDTAPLEDGAHTIAYTGASKSDFDNSVPPKRVEDNTTTSGGNTGTASSNVSVEGVVRSTETIGWTPIGWQGVNFSYCGGYGRENIWAQVNENGGFQLRGLKAGVTYYAEAHGGCTWTQQGPGGCYEPYRSPSVSDMNRDLCDNMADPMGLNDFLYESSETVKYVSIKLNQVPKSIGEIKIYVKSSGGFPLANSNVNISPDHTAWSTNSCTGMQDWNTVRSEPGFANFNKPASATGYVLLDGLPSGNYMINVWTPFSTNGGSSVNSGPDGKFPWEWNTGHCTGDGMDDFRIAIDTMSTPTLTVFDRLGNPYVGVSSTVIVGISSITVVVQTGGGNPTGLVKGTLRFSQPADLTETPLMITLSPNCGDSEGGCQGKSGNLALSTGAVASHYYEIPVSTGASYWMDVRVKNWGRVRSGDGNNDISLKSTGTVTLDMSFVPGGTVKGTLYKPDGTVFIPANNEWVSVNADSDKGWASSQLEKDGTFAITSALPGENRLNVHISQGGDSKVQSKYSLPWPSPKVNVIPGAEATVNLNLVNANYVGIKLSTGMLPDATVITTTGSHKSTIMGFRVVTLPAGTVLKGETITSMFFGDGGDYNQRFSYSVATSTGDNQTECGPGWPGGFCGIRMPSPSKHDFYLMRNGDFGDMKEGGPVENAPMPHFVLLTSSKNVVVDDAHATASIRAKTYESSVPVSGVEVDLSPATNLSGRGNATLFGQVTAANFFRQADYDACGGDFEKFTEFLPVVTLYNDSSVFSAAGIVVPPMQWIGANEDNFDLTFAQGYAQFKSFLDTAPGFFYEIRGLAPSPEGCYTAVVTTPNYPPYQKRTCMGLSGSTTTLNVNLDSAVGAGATVKGYVHSSVSTATVLSNVSVELSGEGLVTKTAVTNSSGAYKFEGLPAGTVKLKATLDGYAPFHAEQDLVGTNTYPLNFPLTAAGGSMTGTVYSQKLPYAKVQAGAPIVAYDDTYNGLNPDKPVALLKTQTGTDGTYTLTGLVPGNVYKVFLKVPGKYTLSVSTPATSGNVAGVDFEMKPKPMDLEIFAKKAEAAYEFTVLNPQDYKKGSVKIGQKPYADGAAVEIAMESLSSGELRGRIPLAFLGEFTWVLHASATSYSNKNVVRELEFSKSFLGNADQKIDSAILGDESVDEKGRKSNEIPLDRSGDNPSAIVFPPGSAQAVSTGAIPTCSFKGEAKNSSAVADKVAALGADAFAGDLYTLSLTSVTVNEGKSLELTLAYDKSGSDLDDLGVARYNDATSKWETVPGVATVDPLKGTVKVKLKSLASVLSVRGGVKPQFNRFDGKQYVVRPQAAGSGSSSGTFAVVKPSVAGTTASGAKLKVFNYPNPFNLKDKAISNNNGAALPGTVNGTVIHVEVPAGNGGPGHVRIYTLAGELVKDIKVDFTSGVYNYVAWDGHNSGGQEVANGVYYGVVEMTGKKPKLKDATFKMAVIK